MSEVTTREGVAGQIVANVFLLVCLSLYLITGTTKVSSPAQLEVWS